MEGKLDPAIKQYFDRQFETLKHELAEQHEKQSVIIQKKLKTDITFRFKGNEKQYKFNCQVKDNLEATTAHINSGRLEKALELIQEGTESLDFRNKCILMADQSDGGWSTVDEYLNKPVADDSDDDRKIRRAENAAIRVKQRRRGRGRDRGRGTRQNYSNNSYSHVDASGGFPQQYKQHYQQYPNIQLPYKPRGPKPTDTCMGCGLLGHWKRECPHTPRTKATGHSTAD